MLDVDHVFAQLYPQKTLQDFSDQEFQEYIWFLSYLTDFGIDEDYEFQEEHIQKFINLSLDDKKRINPNFIPNNTFFERIEDFFYIEEIIGTTAYNLAQGQGPSLVDGWDTPDLMLYMLHNALKGTESYIDLTINSRKKGGYNETSKNAFYYMFFSDYIKGQPMNLIVEILDKMIERGADFNINQLVPLGEDDKDITYAESFLTWMNSQNYLKILEISLKLNPTKIDLEHFIRILKLLCDQVNFITQPQDMSVIIQYISVSLKEEELPAIIEHMHDYIDHTENLDFLLSIFTGIDIKNSKKLNQIDADNRHIYINKILHILDILVNNILEKQTNSQDIIKFLNKMTGIIIEYLSILANSYGSLNNNNNNSKETKGEGIEEDFQQFSNILSRLFNIICTESPRNILTEKSSIRHDLLQPIMSFISANLKNTFINKCIYETMLKSNFAVNTLHHHAQLKQRENQLYLLISPYLLPEERARHEVEMLKQIEHNDANNKQKGSFFDEGTSSKQEDKRLRKSHSF